MYCAKVVLGIKDEIAQTSRLDWLPDIHDVVGHERASFVSASGIAQDNG
jgi:hypothetical protein